MEKRSQLKIMVLMVGVFVTVICALFWLGPWLTTEYHPLPASPELEEIRKDYKARGYLTEEDANKLDKIQEEHVRELKRNR